MSNKSKLNKDKDTPQSNNPVDPMKDKDTPQSNMPTGNWISWKKYQRSKKKSKR